MLGPIVTGILFSLVMLGISLKNPNVGRFILGMFFLVMAQYQKKSPGEEMTCFCYLRDI